MFAIIALMAAALASTTEARSVSARAQAATKVPAGCKSINANTYPGLVNPGTCISQVKSTEIDNLVTGVQIGTVNNWAGGRIPPALRGVFYLEGDVFSAEVVSFGASYWNSSTQTFDVATFSPKTWTSDIGSGQPKNNLEMGVVFQSNCTTNPSNGFLNCLTQQYNFEQNTAKNWGDYTCDQTDASGEVFLRSSNLGIVPILGNPIPGSGSQKAPIRYTYRMWKIIDDQGKRTDRWQKNYIADIGNFLISYNTGQTFVHLGEYQEVIH